MLSIRAIKSAKGAANYYFKDNYYVNDSEEAIKNSVWGGKCAEKLGLEGQVSKEDFENILNGILPDGSVVGKGKHRPGYDLTFSAPKTVSILALVGGDKRLIEAHEVAVDYALNGIERKYPQARKMEKGRLKYEETGNLVYAKFTHYSSRAKDPQMHTHTVTANLTCCADGRYRSLSSQNYKEKVTVNSNGFGERIFSHKIYEGAVYRAKLAALVVSLGYKIRKIGKDGCFEIVGVPQEVIKCFSKRRMKIEEVMDERGVEGGKLSAMVAEITREGKQNIDRKTLEPEWELFEKYLNFSSKDFIKDICRQKAKKEEVGGELKEGEREKQERKIALRAVQIAYKHLTERESVFNQDKLEIAAYAHAIGDVSPEKIIESIERYRKRGELVLGSLPTEHEVYWTTKKSIKLEKENIKILKSGKGKIESICRPISVQIALAAREKLGLTYGQEQATTMILTTNDRFSAIQGYAGVGKTFMLSTVKEIGEGEGYTFRGVTPTTGAARKLQEETKMPCQTIDSFLHKMRWLSKKEQINPAEFSKTVFVVDEASLQSTRLANDFIKWVSNLGARCVMVGDEKQHEAVEAGTPFKQMLSETGISVVRMQDILRQKNKNLLKAVKSTIKGDVNEAIEQIGKENITIMKDTSERQKFIADKYLSYTLKEREQVMVITPAHEDRVVVNELIREGLKREGILEKKGNESSVLISADMSLYARKFSENYNAVKEENKERGEVVVLFSLGDESLGIEKGSYFTVKNACKEKKEVILLQPDGKTIKWYPKRSDAIEVFREEKREIAVGDLIQWRKNDKSLGLDNGNMAVVKAISGEKVTLLVQKEKNDKTVVIDLSHPGQQHWDHAYAKTSYAVQGLTSEKVIFHAESFRKNLSSLSTMYVAFSRASQEVFIVTDDIKKFTRQVIKNSEPTKTALWCEERVKAYQEEQKEEEKTNITEKKTTEVKNKKDSEKKVKLSYKTEEVKEKPIYWDAEYITRRLQDRTEYVVEKLLGKPNARLSNAKAWCYGRQGSLNVNMTEGAERGLWYNFETSKGGNILQLVQNELGSRDFTELLSFAAGLVGLSKEEATCFSKKELSKPTVPKKTIVLDQEELKRINKAKGIFDKTRSIKGTVAERYLREHRGIKCELSDNLRFHRGIKDYESGKFYPALVAVAHNEKGRVMAVQTTLLDAKTGRKADVSVVKRTYGVMKSGASVMVQSGNDQILVAEGIETALSVAESMPGKTVISTFGIQNFKNAILPKNQQPVILCVDNDGNGEVGEVQGNLDGVRNFSKQGHDVFLTCPKGIEGKPKTDFNDVHRQTGIDGVSKTIEGAVLFKKADRSKEVLELKGAQLNVQTFKQDEKINQTSKSISPSQDFIQLLDQVKVDIHHKEKDVLSQLDSIRIGKGVEINQQIQDGFERV